MISGKAASLSVTTGRSGDPSVGYSSHGRFSTLRAIKALEVKERGNEWFDDSGLNLDKTKAVWVCYTPEEALRYSFSSALMDFPRKRPEGVDLSEWKEWLTQIRDAKSYVVQISLKGSLPTVDDDDGGRLHVWPVMKARTASKSGRYIQRLGDDAGQTVTRRRRRRCIQPSNKRQPSASSSRRGLRK